LAKNNISSQIKNRRGQTNLFPSVLFSFFQLIATLLTSDRLPEYLATKKPSILHALQRVSPCKGLCEENGMKKLPEKQRDQKKNKEKALLLKEIYVGK
jgi:hypothetical protein